MSLETVLSSVISLVVGGLITWLASWRYYKKAGDELKVTASNLSYALMESNRILELVGEKLGVPIEVQRDDKGNITTLTLSAIGTAAGASAARGGGTIAPQHEPPPKDEPKT